MSDSFLHLGLQELSELVQKAEKALAEKKKSERKNVIAQIKELADSIGVSITIHESGVKAVSSEKVARWLRNTVTRPIPNRPGPVVASSPAG